MTEKDPFTNINALYDYEQYDELDENGLSELAKELGILNHVELAEKVDELSDDDKDFNDDEKFSCLDNNGFPIISEYFSNTVIPYEQNLKMTEIINKSSNQKKLVPKEPDFSKMKSYGIAEYLIASCVNIIRIDGLTYFYCQSNGTYYCLHNAENRSKFKNELPTKTHSQINSIDKVINELLTMPNIESREFAEGNNGSLINFKDGVLDIFSKEVYEHSPKYTFTYCINAYTSDIDV